MYIQQHVRSAYAVYAVLLKASVRMYTQNVQRERRVKEADFNARALALRWVYTLSVHWVYIKCTLSCVLY